MATQLFSEELGIDLSLQTDEEIFKWFLASVLFGSNIISSLAIQTYRAFEAQGLLSLHRLAKAAKSRINQILKEGGYVRYRRRKLEQILRDCQKLIIDYGGSLLRLHAIATDEKDLEKRLLDFYGIGPVTANIFLRELRPFWTKANPQPLKQVTKLAQTKHIPLSEFSRKSWEFVRLESHLLRELRTEGEARKARSRGGNAFLLTARRGNNC